MATINPFDLLDDDAEDPSQLIAAAEQQQKLAAPAEAKKAPAAAKASAKLPAKPLPPSQAVRESRNDGQRGGRGAGRGGIRGGRGGRGFNRDLPDNENTNNGFSNGYARPSENKDFEKDPAERRSYDAPRGGGGGGGGGVFRGGRRGGFNNGETVEGERPRRTFDRRSGTGRAPGIKREGAGRGNWGTTNDEIVQETEEVVNEVENNVESEKQPGQDEDVVDANKEADKTEPEEKEEEKEPEEKEMTLEEYEKVLEEKRKALLALKSEERKVNLDKELEAMKPLSNKKNADEFFAKLGSDKVNKTKEAAEKAKKSVSINEFLKPAEGENFHRGGGGRGRGGRGRGGRGGGGGYGGNNYSNVAAPAIEDVGQFPSLAAK